MESGTSKSKVKHHVGKYELGHTIGEGTFAKVRFAKNIETGEPVAIKILDKEKVLKHKLVEQYHSCSIRHEDLRILLLEIAGCCIDIQNIGNQYFHLLPFAQYVTQSIRVA
ncbi:hypothetical protein ZIOFF_046992 [Zingiber officinale]|uniref:Protein kinase domain-containing protein n=1 Tax=Zingiber officinale TaxID=94328 RepID=A0A8J5FX10_ZINOF|nr:hypothetical protein ZIOFF_046992 [Zingiber officinale]